MIHRFVSWAVQASGGSPGSPAGMEELDTFGKNLPLGGKECGVDDGGGRSGAGPGGADRLARLLVLGIQFAGLLEVLHYDPHRAIDAFGILRTDGLGRGELVLEDGQPSNDGRHHPVDDRLDGAVGGER